MGARVPGTQLAALDQAPAGHACDRLTDHEMIKQSNVHQFEGRLQSAGDSLVSLTRLRDAGRVVMRQDHGGCIDRQRLLDHFSRVDAGPVNRATEQLLERDDPVPVVEIDAAEQLVFEASERDLQVVFGVSGAADRDAGLELR